MAFLSIAKGLFDFLNSGNRSSYTPVKYDPSDYAETGDKDKKTFGYTDLEDSINSAANSVAKENEEPKKKDEGYGDTAAWVGAAVNLLSNMEEERQQKQANLMAQQNTSANYGLNAMGYAGNALDRLNRGRMGSYGLSSMAGR